jgi:hypothetical protein
MPSLSRAQSSTDVAGVAERYMELTLAGDVDGAADLYAPDVLFIDPTTDVFNFDLAMGLEGPEAVTAVQRSWGIDVMSLNVTRSFVSGRHALYYGPLTVQYQAGTTAGPMPFVTVLKVADGQVVERTDFGDYVGYTDRVGKGEAGATGAALVRTATEYMNAYGEMRFEDWRELYGPSPVFQDPTLEVFGEEADAPRIGADAIVSWFTDNVDGTLAFDVSIEDAFYTPSHAVFLSTVRSTVDGESVGGPEGPVQVEVPMVTALTFEAGKIVGHRDFWDAEAWITSIQESGGTEQGTSPDPEESDHGRSSTAPGAR